MMSEKHPVKKSDMQKVRNLRDAWYRLRGYKKGYYYVDKGILNKFVQNGPSRERGILKKFKVYPEQAVDQIPAGRGGAGVTTYFIKK